MPIIMLLLLWRMKILKMLLVVITAFYCLVKAAALTIPSDALELAALDSLTQSSKVHLVPILKLLALSNSKIVLDGLQNLKHFLYV